MSLCTSVCSSGKWGYPYHLLLCMTILKMSELIQEEHLPGQGMGQVVRKVCSELITTTVTFLTRAFVLPV